MFYFTLSPTLCSCCTFQICKQFHIRMIHVAMVKSHTSSWITPDLSNCLTYFDSLESVVGKSSCVSLVFSGCSSQCSMAQSQRAAWWPSPVPLPSGRPLQPLQTPLWPPPSASQPRPGAGLQLPPRPLHRVGPPPPDPPKDCHRLLPGCKCDILI